MPQTIQEILNEVTELMDIDCWKEASAIICEKLIHKDKFRDATIIPDILPLAVEFLSSLDATVQQEGAYFLGVITSTSHGTKTEKEFIQDVIDANAVPELLRLLESHAPAVVEQSLQCLKNISYSFPEAIVKHPSQIFPQLFGKDICLQSNIEKIKKLSSDLIKNLSYYRPSIEDIVKFGAISMIKGILKDAKLCEFVANISCILRNISNNQQFIPVIVAENYIPILLNILKSKRLDMCYKKILQILVNIVSYDAEKCQMVLDYGGLQLVKQKFSNPSMKPIALNFIENMLYSENDVEHIMTDEKFFTSILKQINISRVADEIKIIAIKIVLIIVQKKPAFIPKLINDYDLISLLCDNLGSNNLEMVIISLSAIYDIIEGVEYETVKQTLIKSRIQEKLNKFHQHENDQIKELATKIKNFFISKYVQQRRSADRKVKRDMPRSELGESSSSSIQNQENGQKRTAQSEERGGRKKSRVSMAPTETSEEEEDERHDDPDDIHPREPFPDDALADVAEAEAPPVRKRSPVSSPIQFSNPLEALPNTDQQSNQEIRSQDVPVNVVNPNEALPTTDQQADNFTIFIKTFPSWQFFDFCCKELLGIEFDKNLCLQFLAQNKFNEIKSTSKPASCLPSTTTDRSGFSCFSLIFYGKDDPTITDKIKQAINRLFHRKYSGILDTAEMESVIFSEKLTEKHIRFVAEHFNFRILVYFNEEWKKLGDFGDDETPLFLIEKKVDQEGIKYEIVLSLED